MNSPNANYDQGNHLSISLTFYKKLSSQFPFAKKTQTVSVEKLRISLSYQKAARTYNVGVIGICTKIVYSKDPFFFETSALSDQIS